jgi:poly(A) polymerase
MLLYTQVMTKNEDAIIIAILKKILKKRRLSQQRKALRQQLKIIPRAEHNLSRQAISKLALQVLYRLHEAGYDAYLVGGSVRDLLLNRKPKDFDVATNAHPEQVKRLFRNCRLIGRRFRLAHIYSGNEIVEVATFRAGETADAQRQLSQHGMILQDNTYGTLEEDALRRDFTINSLYYNIADYSVVDYGGGIADLRAGLLRIIGNPRQRYHEDPVRLLRAIRFAAQLNFTIEPVTAKPIAELANLLTHVSSARLFEEVLKLFFSGYGVRSYQQLRQHSLFDHLFHQTEHLLQQTNPLAERLIELTLLNTDQRLAIGKRVTPAFLFAALLWYPLINKVNAYEMAGISKAAAWHQAIHEVLREQLQQLAIPKRFTTMMQEIWLLQPRLQQCPPQRVPRLLVMSRFRAAYDFLLLRAQAGEPLQAIADWWTEIQTADFERQQQLLAELRTNSPPKKTVKKNRWRSRRRLKSNVASTV